MVFRSADLDALADMTKDALRIEWRRVFRTAPPDLGADLLRRGIAWQMQAKQHGGLSREALRRLSAIAAGEPVGAECAPGCRPKPGTRLVREWNGKTLVVLVTEAGFVFEDRSYGSLSEIARAVTGTRWSGPRFFGLKAKQRRT